MLANVLIVVMLISLLLSVIILCGLWLHFLRESSGGILEPISLLTLGHGYGFAIGLLLNDKLTY